MHALENTVLCSCALKGSAEGYIYLYSGIFPEASPKNPVADRHHHLDGDVQHFDSTLLALLCK